MLTSDDTIILNPAQERPKRLSIYAINRCENQVIGFEFTKKEQVPTSTNFCNNVVVNSCVIVESPVSLGSESFEFLATDDPCFDNWLINKTESPHIEIQKNDDDLVVGVLVNFFKDETKCLPNQIAFRLYINDENNCRYRLSSGLLLIR